MIKKLLALTTTFEAATGLILLVYPPVVVRLLFGAEMTGVGIVVSRIAGISLIALGLACWPGRDAGNSAARALRAMLCYNLFATLYLAYLGLGGEWVGSLLWLAVAIHALWTFLLAHAWLIDQRARGVPTTFETK
jgi:hypothetical protein